MNTNASRFALTMALASLVCACDAPPGLEGAQTLRAGGQDTLPSSGGGMWINNGLDDPDVSGIDPALALTSDAGLSSLEAVLLDPARHDTVRYLLECALPAGHSLELLVDEQPTPFDGVLGLAPEWVDGACDDDCQEWVSACMLARTNVSGATVPVWMSADHSAIGEGSSPAFPVYEATFFGNLFEGSRYYCGGTGGAVLGQLRGRTCTGGSCGFIEYDHCAQKDRCEYASLGAPAGGAAAGHAIACVGGSLAEGRAFHAINTYVGG